MKRPYFENGVVADALYTEDGAIAFYHQGGRDYIPNYERAENRAAKAYGKLCKFVGGAFIAVGMFAGYQFTPQLLTSSEDWTKAQAELPEIKRDIEILRTSQGGVRLDNIGLIPYGASTCGPLVGGFTSKLKPDVYARDREGAASCLERVAKDYAMPYEKMHVRETLGVSFFTLGFGAVFGCLAWGVAGLVYGGAVRNGLRAKYILSAEKTFPRNAESGAYGDLSRHDYPKVSKPQMSARPS